MGESQQDMFRGAMENALFKAENEKTKFDKMLSREEMARIRTLFTKTILTLEDLGEVQNILVSDGIKLTDFRRNERYINHKFYMIIQRFASRYDKAIRADQQYQTEFTKQLENPLNLPTEEFEKNKKEIIKAQRIRSEMQKDYSTTYKELVNVFLFGIRSPVSSEGNMLRALGTEKREFVYEGNLSPIPQQSQNKGVE